MLCNNALPVFRPFLRLQVGQDDVADILNTKLLCDIANLNTTVDVFNGVGIVLDVEV